LAAARLMPPVWQAPICGSRAEAHRRRSAEIRGRYTDLVRAPRRDDPRRSGRDQLGEARSEPADLASRSGACSRGEAEIGLDRRKVAEDAAFAAATGPGGDGAPASGTQYGGQYGRKRRASIMSSDLHPLRRRSVTARRWARQDINAHQKRSVAQHKKLLYTQRKKLLFAQRQIRSMLQTRTWLISQGRTPCLRQTRSSRTPWRL
jgi:hypothetical protein